MSTCYYYNTILTICSEKQVCVFSLNRLCVAFRVNEGVRFGRDPTV